MESVEERFNRTDYCGNLRLKDVGRKVSLLGWVSKKRNLGSLLFIDLRDREGYVQICVKTDEIDLPDIRNEYVLEVEGEVSKKDVPNKNLATGEIEVVASKIKVINTALQPPISTQEVTDANDDIRLKYRYLDLRRNCMQKRFKIRANIVKATHSYLDSHDFIEIETPYLSPSTPEGARDYLVPSRVHKGCFYALPQSPQLYKQMLMVSGFERYYQIARCFRDEDLRIDRQPEFTQIDVEMSFMTTDEIITLGEQMIAQVMKDVKGIEISLPLPRMTWHEAMEKYGIDKPDIRFGLELVNLNETVKDVDFMVFKSALEANGYVKGINVKGQANNFSRKAIDKLTDIVKTYKAKGLAWLKVKNGKGEGPIAKFFNDEQMERLLTAMAANDDDLLLFVSDVKYDVVCSSLAALRNHLGKELKLYDPNEFAYLWVVDFPMFEFDDETNRYYAVHHPFTRPKEEDIDKIENDPAHCLADAYDIVLNGFELGGGSQRIYEQDLQERAFKALGFTQERIESQFGWFVEAFQYGTPPHGGFALGLDRLAMILTGSENIREVIAFPKNASAVCPMSKAPSVVDQEQLDELKIAVIEDE